MILCEIYACGVLCVKMLMGSTVFKILVSAIYTVDFVMDCWAVNQCFFTQHTPKKKHWIVYQILLWITKFGVCCKFSGFALVCSVWSLILNPNMVLLCRSYFCLYHFVLHAGYVLSILLRIINCINFGFIAIEKLYLVILVFWKVFWLYTCMFFTWSCLV